MADVTSDSKPAARNDIFQVRLVGLVEQSSALPIWLLSGIVVLFGYSLVFGFMLDDYHCLAVMAEYESGQRDNLHFYQFINGGESNAAARRDGSFAWWLGDDVKYRHWRPLAEYTLYGQYQLFGRNAIGYRLVSLFLYWLGCCLLLRLFRHLTQSEMAARWAIVFFLVHAAHAIPISFISSQADIVAMVLVTISLLSIFLGANRKVRLSGGQTTLAFVVGGIIYAIALGFKESVLPVAVLPAWVAWCAKDRFQFRRAISASVILTSIGLVWLYFYSQGNYGSNTAVMLDPIQRTGEYLLGLPGRSLILLTALAVPINPFIFYFRPYGVVGLYLFCALGVVLILKFAPHIFRLIGRTAFTLALGWILVFLPLLVCTVPDDRIMLLPSIGFAALIGSWLAKSRQGDAPNRRLLGYLGIHAVVTVSVIGIMGAVGYRIEQNLQSMVDHVDSIQPGDSLLLVNSQFDPQVLFGQQTLEAMIDRDDVRFTCLSESEHPRAERVDGRTLRLIDESGFFSGFLGAMGTSRAQPKQLGEVFDAGYYRATLSKVEGERVTEILIEFDEPLDSSRYHFFWGGALGKPEPWLPPPVSSEPNS